MSIENNAADAAPVDTMDDLNAFEAELFGRSEPALEEATSDDVEDTVDEDASQDTDTQDEVDTLDDETDDDEVEVVEEAPKQKKNRFQERIDELTQGRREAERKAEALEARLAALEAAKQNPEPTKEAVVETEGPDPYGKNEDGSDIYPLGEYDPAYLRDYVKHLTAVEREAAKTQDTQKAEQAQMDAERAALQQSWESKLDPARERYPDFQTKSEELISSFNGLDPVYGEYLAAQIMDLEYGTDVLYYLASNPDEAKDIIEGGARKATVALGRLDAKLGYQEEEKQKVRQRVSSAPTPPPVNKGTSAVKDIPDDTDNLADFERKLFARR